MYILPHDASMHIIKGRSKRPFYNKFTVTAFLKVSEKNDEWCKWKRAGTRTHSFAYSLASAPPKLPNLPSWENSSGKEKLKTRHLAAEAAAAGSCLGMSKDSTLTLFEPTLRN
jgi:hypothetical protein